MSVKTKAMNIFEQIKQDNLERLERYREKVFYSKERKEKRNYENYIFDLKQKASKYSELIQDSRYIGVEFLMEMKSNLEKLLQRLCMESQIYEEQVLMTTRIAAKIDIIEKIINDPKKIIEEWENMKKEVDNNEKK